MANKYTTELELKAQFEVDEGSLSKAAAFAQQLSAAIEAPLKSMFERVIGDFLGKSGLGGPGNAGGILIDPNTNRPMSQQGAASSQGFSTPPPAFGPSAPPPGQPAPPTQDEIWQKAAKLANQGYAPHQVRNALGIPLSEFAGTDGVRDFIKKVDPESDTKQSILSDVIKRIASPEAEMQAGNASIMAKMKQAGVSVDVSPAEKEKMKATADEIQKGLKDAFSTIQKSNEALVKKMQETMEEIKKQEELITKHQETDPEKATMAEQNRDALKQTHDALVRKYESDQDDYAAGISKKGRQIKALREPEQVDAAEAAQIRASRMSMGVGALGSAAALAVAYGNLPSQLESHRAGMAGAERFGSRAFGRGDDETAAIVQELGGQKAMYEESRRRESWKAAGGLGAAMIGGGIVGTFLGGPLLGTVLGAGAAGIGYGINKYGSFGRDISASEAERTGNRAEEFREYYDARAAGQSRLKESYRGMVGMGLTDTRAENFLYGGTDVGGGSITSYGANRGVGGSELQNMQRMFLASGGMNAINNTGSTEAFRQMINLQGMGLSNTAEMQAGMAGGMTTNDPKKSFELVKEMYADAVASGMDKTKIAKSMEVAMAQVGGYGGGEIAARRFGELSNAAKTFAGGKEISGPQADFMQQLQSTVANLTGQGGSGLGQVAGFNVAREAMGQKIGKTGKTAKEMMQAQGMSGSALEFALGQNEMSPESIMALVKAQGGDISEEAATQLSESTSAKKRAAGLKGIIGGTYSKEFAPIAAASQLGLKGSAAGFGAAGLEALAEGGAAGLEALAEGGGAGTPEALMTNAAYAKSRSGIKAQIEGEGRIPPASAGGQLTMLEFQRDAEKLKLGLSAAKDSIPSLQQSIKDFTSAIQTATAALRGTGTIPSELNDKSSAFVNKLMDGVFKPN